MRDVEAGLLHCASPPSLNGGPFLPAPLPLLRHLLRRAHPRASALPQERPNVDDYINASLGAWVWKGADNGCSACDGTVGSSTCAWIFPCFAGPPANIFGHHVVLPASVPHAPSAPCNAPLAQGGDAQPCTQWWAGKGPKYEMFTWGLSQTGNQPNANLGQPISFTQPTGIKYVLARSIQAAPYPNCGPGDTGWVELFANNTFGCMNYADANLIDKVCGSFEVAYCNHCPPCPPPGAPPSNQTRPPGCPPCPKPPPPPPPAPPGGQPCIRFGHAIPTTEQVDITITQGSVCVSLPAARLPRPRPRSRPRRRCLRTYTWSNYKFSQFSGWVTKFAVGNGQVTVKSGGQTLFTATKFLTPGPLVMALTGGPPKGPPPGKGGGWPPKSGDNVEMIAASFVPPKTGARIATPRRPEGSQGKRLRPVLLPPGSKVRLFNLATDVPTASLTSGGKTLASGVKYTLGSIPWAPVPAALASFTATASSEGNLTASAGGLATASFNPPAAPEAFTAFLLGTQAFGEPHLAVCKCRTVAYSALCVGRLHARAGSRRPGVRPVPSRRGRPQHAARPAPSAHALQPEGQPAGDVSAAGRLPSSCLTRDHC